MSSFAEMIRSGGWPPFIDKRSFADASTRFCVSKVQSVTQKDNKKRWYLLVHYYADDGSWVEGTLTFDKTDKRNQLMAQLSEELPYHGLYLRLVKLSGQNAGKTTYAFDRDARFTCGCEEEPDVDEDESEDMPDEDTDDGQPF